MTQLLVFREHLQKFYQKNAFVLNSLFRFLTGFIVFYSVNQLIGYNPVLNHRYVEFILALISIIMSGQILLLFSAVIVVVHIFYVSNVLAIVVAFLFAILYYAYVKFVPKHAYIILAFPILFSLNLVYGLPVFLGLIMGPVAVIPIICGVSIYYLLQTITSVISTSTDSSINLYHVVLQQFIDNEEMYVVMLVFAVVAITVYMIRSREWDFAFEIAIAAGAVVNIILTLLINYLLNINLNMLVFFGGTICSILLVWVIQFMRLSLNYAGVENLQFEDEEYYYYVRAVPKMNIAVPSKHVKHINPKRKILEDENKSEQESVD